MKVLDRKYWGAGKGRSPIDRAWKLAARTEASAASDRFSVTPIADYSKYYENIELTQLRQKFIRFGAATASAKLTYNTW
eukprot:1027241-Pyramimonas_sp.AAC.1